MRAGGGRQATLTSGSVGGSLVRLSLPMVMGVFAIIAFNLADALYVARLGTEELAAISFTFPVVMTLGSIALGLGMGATSTISRAIGEGDHRRVRRLATDSLVLALLIVGVLVAVGMLTIDPLFRMLGASDAILPLIREYMTIWYYGMVFLVVPMVGNSAIRATGDMKTPSLIMVIAATVNIVVDPILIFGLFGFPRMELAGAALATVCARATTFIVSFAVLHFRERMILFCLPSLPALWRSWKQVLFVGVPAAAAHMLNPLAMAAVTRIAARFGAPVVAAVGAGTRVESFALIPIMALGTALMPFVGQNWGARRHDRVRTAQRLSLRFALIWGAVVWLGLFAASSLIAKAFTDDPAVYAALRQFLGLIPIGYGLLSASLMVSSILNAVNRPIDSAFLNLIRLFVLLVPLGLLGAYLFKVPGLFSGIALGNLIGGLMAWAWSNRLLAPTPRSRSETVNLTEATSET